MSIVDNCSTDGTQEWMHELKGAIGKHWLNQNYYPGFAANLGWSYAWNDVTHLHRADNDFIFLSGWCEEVERMFSWQPRLGQLGLRTDEEEMWAKWNTGGNCVIPKALWDEGMRWDERPWPQLREEVGNGHTEDSLFTPAVVERGWQWDRVQRPCIQPISFESPEDSYYRDSWAARGIAP